MPSGKKARAQRQQAAAAPPPVRAKGAPGGARQASGRTLAIAGGVILVVIVAVVLGIVLTQSSSAKTTDGTGDGPTIAIAPGTPAVGDASTSALLNATQVESDLKGIPQNGLTLGDPNAPVTLVEYIDLQCPVCASFETTELPELLTKYVRPGKLKIEMKPWNILDGPDGGDDSLRGQKATFGAAAQNKAFNFSNVLYWNQKQEGSGWLNDATVSSIAAAVTGLRPEQLATVANSSGTSSSINAIDDYANARSPSPFSGTPTLLLGKGNEAPKYYGTGSPAMDLSNLEPAIDRLLNQ